MAYNSCVDSGIYKIVSPSGAVYIGQTRNTRQRFNKYKNLSCKSQRKLYNALKKYGFNNCVVEVIHYIKPDAPQALYDFFEILYINIYMSEKNNMLNIRGGGNGIGKMSDETKKLLSDYNKANLNKTVFKKGHKHSSETRKKLSEIKKGKPSGRKGTHLTKKAVEASRTVNKGNKYNAKSVVNIVNNTVYNSLKEAAEAFNMKRTTLGMQLSGHNKNKTTLRWCSDV